MSVLRRALRCRVWGRAVVGIALLMGASVSHAQQPTLRTVPRTPDGKPDLIAIERIVRTRPADAETRVGFAALLLQANDTVRAESELRNAMATPGIDRARVALALGELLGVRGRYAEGEQLLRPFSADSTVRRLRGRLLLVAGARAGRTDEAARLWEQAVQLDPSLVEGWSGLAALAATRDQADSAIAIVSRGLRFNPTDARLLAMQATLLRTDESVAAAVSGLRSARRVKASEENGLALASLLRQQGDATSLLALLDTMLAAPSPGREVFRLAADVRRRRGDRAIALELLTKAQRSYPRDAMLFADEAIIHRDAKEWRLSTQAWLRAIDRTQERAPLEFELAETYVLAGDTVSARAQLRTLADVARPAVVLHRAALRIRELSDTASATAAWRARLAIDTADAAALVGLAESLDAAGQRADARALWLRAEPLTPSGPWPALALRRGAPLEEWRRWTRRAMWRGLEALAGAEQRALGVLDGGTSAESLARARPDLVERERIIGALAPIVDSLAADEAWGKAEVVEAARAWRGAQVLTRAMARADVTHERWASATARYDSLIALRTADPALQIEVGDHYLRVGRVADARVLFTHALEAAPESEAPFRALLALDRSRDALESLEQQVLRLRLRQPKSLVLADRLIEVLHRLGRTADAARVVKELETLRAERAEVPPTTGGRP